MNEDTTYANVDVQQSIFVKEIIRSRVLTNMTIEQIELKRYDKHYAEEQNKFIYKTFQDTLTAEFYQRTKEEKSIEYEFPRPTFLEWLKHKTRKITVLVKSKDILLDPPSDREKYLTVYDYSVKRHL